MEEAIAFAQTHLGIKKMDLGGDVGLANWVNEGLVNINNHFRGKAHMPKNIIWDKKVFAKMNNAKAYHDASTNTLGINKEYFDGMPKWLNEMLTIGKTANENVKTGKFSTADFVNQVFSSRMSEDGKFAIVCGLDAKIQQKIIDKITRYEKDPNNFSRFEINEITELYGNLQVSCKKMFDEPIKVIEKVFEKHPDLKNGIGLTLDKCKDMKPSAQRYVVIRLLKKVNSKNVRVSEMEGFSGAFSGNSPFDTVYHEMGHLLHHMNISLKDSFWGCLSEKSIKEFQNNSEKQRIANMISWYAPTDPFELVAERFAAQINGCILPKECDDLAKAYKAPEV